MGQLTKDQIRESQEEGYILFKGLFDAEEIELLRSTAKADRELDKHSFARADGEGGKVRLSLWNHPGYTPLKKVDDAMIKKAGHRSFENGDQN